MHRLRTGLCHDDGTEVTLTPGMWLTDPKATATASATPAKKPLVIRAVLPKGR